MFIRRHAAKSQHGAYRCEASLSHCLVGFIVYKYFRPCPSYTDYKLAPPLTKAAEWQTGERKGRSSTVQGKSSDANSYSWRVLRREKCWKVQLCQLMSVKVPNPWQARLVLLSLRQHRYNTVFMYTNITDL